MHSVFEGDLKKLRCSEETADLETFCCTAVETVESRRAISTNKLDDFSRYIMLIPSISSFSPTKRHTHRGHRRHRCLWNI